MSVIITFFFPSLLHQNTGETPHQEQCCLWEALNLQTLLLVCAHRGPDPLWAGGSSCALPLDLPHLRSSRRLPRRTPGSHRLSGKLSHYATDLLHHVFILQQEEEHGQHVNHQVHEEMYWPRAGRETHTNTFLNYHADFTATFKFFCALNLVALFGIVFFKDYLMEIHF